MSVLSLQNTIIYGPIASRRFGPSLGINLLPAEMKVCSFNCVYCHYGWTFLQTDEADFISDSFPSPSEVARSLERALEQIAAAGAKLNVITFSGNGEPTLHPRFPAVVDAVLSVRDRLTPDLPVQILCNSANLKKSEVIGALKKLDRRIMKLDAGSQDLLDRINKPVGNLSLKEIVEALKALGEICIQSAFMSGSVDNSTDVAVRDWLEVLMGIKPSEVQIYTLDRPAADSALRQVDRDRLLEIAGMVRAQGINAAVF